MKTPTSGTPTSGAAHREGYRVLLVEFSARDIAVIPTATDGKFRVHKCKVIREVDLEPIFAAEREPATEEEA